MLTLSRLSAADDISSPVYTEGLKKYILRDYKGAIKNFENAHKLDKKNQIIRRMYVKALVKQGNIEYNQLDLEAAAKYYSKALTLLPHDQELQNKLNLIKKQIIRNKGYNKKRYTTNIFGRSRKRKSRNPDRHSPRSSLQRSRRRLGSSRRLLSNTGRIPK